MPPSKITEHELNEFIAYGHTRMQIVDFIYLLDTECFELN